MSLENQNNRSLNPKENANTNQKATHRFLQVMSVAKAADSA